MKVKKTAKGNYQVTMNEVEGYWGVEHKETPLDPTHWMPMPKTP